MRSNSCSFDLMVENKKCKFLLANGNNLQAEEPISILRENGYEVEIFKDSIKELFGLKRGWVRGIAQGMSQDDI